MKKLINIATALLLMNLNISYNYSSKPYDSIMLFIKNSNFLFIRNGHTYSADQAYQWFLFKVVHKQFKDNPINSECDFIKRVATKSNKTGIRYEIILESGIRKYLGIYLNEKYECEEKK